jgi:hypothetical protein
VFALWPITKKRWQRIALFSYPMLTLFCIIVTGNHFWLDGLGGLIVFGVGYVIGTKLHNWNHHRLDLKLAAQMASHPSF